MGIHGLYVRVKQPGIENDKQVLISQEKKKLTLVSFLEGAYKE